jgi:DHA2 family multidrug resistance protein
MIGFAGWMMQSWSATADLWEVAIAGFLMGAGVSQAYVSLTVMAMATVAQKIRVECVSLYSLILNMGSGMGIAIAIVALSQYIQIHHEVLASNVTKFSDIFRDHLLPHLWNFGSSSGLSAVDKVIQIQANTLAFNQTFRLMMLNAFAVIPFLYLLTRPKRAGTKR